MLNVSDVNDSVPTLIGKGKYVGVIKKAEGKVADTGRFFAKFSILIQEAETGTKVIAKVTDELKKSGEPIVEWDEAIDEDTGQVIVPEGEYLNLTLFYPKKGDKLSYSDKQMALLKGLLKAIREQVELQDDEKVDIEEFVAKLTGIRIGVRVSDPRIFTQNEDEEWVLSDYPGNNLQGFFKAE